jgi:hypothetical protein
MHAPKPLPTRAAVPPETRASSAKYVMGASRTPSHTVATFHRKLITVSIRARCMALRKR